MHKVCAYGVLILMIASIAMAAQDSEALKSALENYNDAHYAKALDYFTEASKAGPKEEEAKFIDYAIETLKGMKGRFDEIERGETALRETPEDKLLSESLFKKHYLLAHTLVQRPFYLAMVEPHLKRAIGLNKDFVWAYADLGNAYYASMKYREAVESYEGAIKLEQSSPQIYRIAADASVAMGDFDKAKKFYTDAIRANRSSKSAYSSGEIDKIKTVLKVLPETYKDIDELLKAYRLDEAAVILKRRISLNRADYIAITSLGFIYQQKGDRKNAMRMFEEAIRIAPDYPLSHLYLGRLYFVMRDYNKALSELSLFKDKMNKLPKIEGDIKKTYIDGLYYISEVYFTLGRFMDAKGQVEEILKLDPKEQDAYYSLGVYFYKREYNRAKAYQYFTKVIDLDPATSTAKHARYAIEFMRANPDPRISPDFSFIEREYRD